MKRVAVDLVAKFLDRVSCSLTELIRSDGDWKDHPCILWEGSKINYSGGGNDNNYRHDYRVRLNTPYGIFRGTTAHAWLYRTFVRATRPGEHVHHKCHNAQCVRLCHLEAKMPKAHGQDHAEDHKGPRKLQKGNYGKRYTPKRRYKTEELYDA